MKLHDIITDMVKVDLVLEMILILILTHQDFNSAVKEGKKRSISMSILSQDYYRCKLQILSSSCPAHFSVLQWT